MIPTKSNLTEKGCSPVSSNCVIWQGPCIPCISVNTGDSISDVVAEIASQICILTESLNVSQVDFKCLVDSSLNTPQPEKTLNSFLALLIDKVCAIEDILDHLADPDTPSEVNLQIAACFQTNDLNGDPILSLPIADYVRTIGNKVCALATTVDQHTSTLSNHETRITTLENAGDEEISLPTVTPVCVFGSDHTAKDLDVMVEALEQEFCTLRSATGVATDLLQAAGKQCANLNNAPALSASGNMSGISGWKTTVSTVADSLNNLWLTLCDIRSAVDAVKACCAKTCNDVVVNFLANIVDNGATIKLYFPGYTILPSGFTDCTTQGSKLTISDGVGGTYVTYIVLSTVSSGVDPVSIALTSTPLNPTGSYTFTLDSCVTDGSLICNKTIVVNATGTPLSCSPPSNVSVTLS